MIYNTIRQPIHEHIHSVLHVFKDRGHFLQSDFPELVKFVREKIPELNALPQEGDDEGSSSSTASASVAADGKLNLRA